MCAKKIFIVLWLVLGYLLLGQSLAFPEYCYSDTEVAEMLSIITKCKSDYQTWKNMLVDLQTEAGNLRKLRTDFEKRINNLQTQLQNYETLTGNMQNENKILLTQSEGLKQAVEKLNQDLIDLISSYEKKLNETKFVFGGGGIAAGMLAMFLIMFFSGHTK